MALFTKSVMLNDPSLVILWPDVERMLRVVLLYQQLKVTISG